VPSADKRQRKKENARAAREARVAAEKRSKRLRTFRNVGIVVVLFIVVVVLVNVVSGGSSKKKASSSTTVSSTPTTAHTVSAPDFKLDPGKTYTANIATNYGPITIKLDTKKAPVAAGHFIKLAKAGFYNGSRWHRIAKDFVIQGGAPGGDPTKNYGHPVVGETPTNNYPIGAVAAAKTQSDAPGTFDSQFFIVTGSQGATLPNDYASFGTVTAGMDNAQKIAALVPASGDGEPTKKATIDTITITES
jgi:cyclophilin family peptidyl-prolyl cis-trans isomerase